MDLSTKGKLEPPTRLIGLLKGCTTASHFDVAQRVNNEVTGMYFIIEKIGDSIQIIDLRQISSSLNVLFPCSDFYGFPLL